MSIKIISEEFPNDENGNNNEFFKVSELIAKMELDSLSDPTIDKIKLTYLFSQNRPNWIPVVKTIDRECSEKIVSKKLESKINSRLLQIANSDEMTFYYENTDEVLFNKIKDLHQTIELREEAEQNKISKEEFYRSEPEGTWLVENPSRSNKLLYLLIAASNTKIHHVTLQRIQKHLDTA
ncbi:hypothetical protein [Aquipluma nitroreducens]|nr:hypothetical protein [Aquipluma nitroreducens]